MSTPTGLRVWAISFFFCFTFSTAFSTIIYTKADAVGNNDGSSWTHAFTNLQDALAASTLPDDTIWVAAGTYYPSPSDRTVYFDLTEGIKLFGGFDGTESLLNQRDWIANVTILSGDLDMDGDTTNNSYTILHMDEVSQATQLDGFTIDLGNANHAMSSDIRHRTGGALYIDSGISGLTNPIIRNCIFSNHYASTNGGAIYVDGVAGGDASPSLENCTFTNNESVFKGGAVFNGGNCTAVFLYCQFSLNKSTDGGAVFNDGTGAAASPDFINSTFDNNTATNYGGAVFNFGKLPMGASSPLLFGCLVYDNIALSGAGIYSIASEGIVQPQIINGTYVNNYATNAGGHIYANESNGGLAEVSVYNTILWGSTSNWAPHFGFSGNGDPEIIIDFLIADAIDCADLKKSATGTLTCGSTVFYNVDPLFEDADNNDFRIQQYSPAINSGDNTQVPADLHDADNDGNTTEQIDIDLLLDPRLDNATIDLGPYEKTGGLPIELLSFDARWEAGVVAINWITLSEDNNDFFHVERSTNGIDFQPIHRTEGAGTSDRPLHYQAFDDNPFAGTNYYRLKQTDFDGRFSYSDIRAVEVLGDQQLEVFPNPVTRELRLALSQFNVREIAYEVVHLSGKRMFAGQAAVNDGLVVVSSDAVNDLPPGNYIVRIGDAHQRQLYGKFVKIGL